MSFFSPFIFERKAERRRFYDEIFMKLKILHGNNDFAEGFKILLDTDLKIILLDS